MPAALVAFAVGGCGAGPVGPPDTDDELSVRVETARGVYLHAPGDPINIEAQDAYYAWLYERMGLDGAEPLVYLKYRDRAHMGRRTGRGNTNGWAEVGTRRFHTIWDFDNHESVHALVSAEWNAAPALMNEGIAVAHQTLPHLGIHEPVWNGDPVDSIAAWAMRDGLLPSLEGLLDSGNFRRLDQGFAYPLSGSFVKSIIERHGYRAIETFFRSSDIDDSGEALRSRFRIAFGEEIENAWSVWQASLD